MRIVFAGTPEFAVPCLSALLSSSHEVLAVYTQPDRPAGRGQQLRGSAIKQLSETHRLPIHQPAQLHSPLEQQILTHYQPEIMIIVAYGLIIPQNLLNIPTYGCLNVHASLLPRWRGAAPIQRAIEAGDIETGITIMQMDAGLDTGAILLQKDCEILPYDTAQTLQGRLSKLGATCLITSLEKLSQLQASALPQSTLGMCYASKIKKAEAELDWKQPATQLAQKIRAFHPWPVAFSFVNGIRLRVWEAHVDEAAHYSSSMLPGTVATLHQEAMQVVTGSGCLSITQLQQEGGKCLPLSDWYNAKPTWLAPGVQLGASQVNR